MGLTPKQQELLDKACKEHRTIDTRFGPVTLGRRHEIEMTKTSVVVPPIIDDYLGRMKPFGWIYNGTMHWTDEEYHAAHDAGLLPWRFEQMTPEEIAEMEAEGEEPPHA